MKKLNICIDIDGTLTEPFYWLEAANEWFETHVKPGDITEYDIHEVLGISREAYLDFYDVCSMEIHRDAEPRVLASAVLQQLAQVHNIYYVTARQPYLELTTREWLGKNGFPEAPLYLLGSHHKVRKAEELKCDLFIEDRYENALELTLAGIRVLLIDCTYNRRSSILDMVRIFSWQDAHRKINALANGHEPLFRTA